MKNMWGIMRCDEWHDRALRKLTDDFTCANCVS